MPLRIDTSPAGAASGGNLDKILRFLGDGLSKIVNFLNGTDTSPGPDFNAITINDQLGTTGPVNPQRGTIVRTHLNNWRPRNSAGTQQSNPGLYWYDGNGWRQFLTLAESTGIDSLDLDYVPIDTTLSPRVGYMNNAEAFGAKNSSGTIEIGYIPRDEDNNSIVQVGDGGILKARDANAIQRAFLDLSDEWGVLGLSGKAAAPSSSSVGVRIQLNQGDGRWSIGLSEAAEGSLYSRGNNPMVIDPLYGWIIEQESNGVGSVLRKVTMDGGVHLWAGSYTATGTTNGTGTAARFGAYPEWGFMEVEPGTRRAVLLEYDFDPGASGYTYAGACRLRTVNLDTAEIATAVSNISRSGAAVRCGCFDSSGYLWLFYIGATVGAGDLIARKYETSGWTYTEYDITTYSLGVGAYTGRAIYDPTNNCFYVSCEYGIIKYVGGATTSTLWVGSFVTAAQTDGNGTSARFLHGIPFMQISGTTLYVITCGYNVGAGTPPYNTYTIRLVNTSTADVTTQHYAGPGVGDTRLSAYLLFNNQAYYFAFRNVNHTGVLKACIFRDTITADPGTTFSLSDPICPATTGLKAINFGSAYDGGGPDMVWLASQGGFQVTDDSGNDLLTVLPSLTINDPVDAKVYLASLKTLHNYSTVAPGAGAYTLDLASVALYPHNVVKVSPTSAGNVNVISNGTSGQILTIIAGNANLTITNGASLILSGGVDFVMASGDTVTLENEAGTWREITRNPTNIAYGTSTPGAGNFTLTMSSFGIISHPVIKISPSAAAAMNNITGGYDGQSVSVVAGNANLTINYVGGTIETRGAANYAMAANEVCTLVRAGGVWYESARTP